MAPALNKRLTTTLILDAFPGIGLDEKTTVSPGLILTNLCVPLAIRLNAAKASPWLPVHRIKISLSGNFFASLLLIKKESGALI